MLYPFYEFFQKGTLQRVSNTLIAASSTLRSQVSKCVQVKFEMQPTHPAIEASLSALPTASQGQNPLAIEIANMINPRLDQMGAGIKAIELKLDAMTERISRLETEAAEKDATIADLNQRLTYMEAQNMRNNVIFNGPGLHADEGKDDWETEEMKIKDLLAKHGINDAYIERCHRMGRKGSGKSRAIVAKFLSYKSREAVLRNKAGFRRQQIYVTEQLPQTIVQKRREMRAAAEAQFGQLGDGTNGTTKVINKFDKVLINRVLYDMQNSKLIPVHELNRQKRHRSGEGEMEVSKGGRFD